MPRAHLRTSSQKNHTDGWKGIGQDLAKIAEKDGKGLAKQDEDEAEKDGVQIAKKGINQAMGTPPSFVQDSWPEWFDKMKDAFDETEQRIKKTLTPYVNAAETEAKK